VPCPLQASHTFPMIAQPHSERSTVTSHCGVSRRARALCCRRRSRRSRIRWSACCAPWWQPSSIAFGRCQRPRSGSCRLARWCVVHLCDCRRWLLVAQAHRLLAHLAFWQLTFAFACVGAWGRTQDSVWGEPMAAGARDAGRSVRGRHADGALQLARPVEMGDLEEPPDDHTAVCLAAALCAAAVCAAIVCCCAARAFLRDSLT